jgi:hypothetical protein
VQQTRLANSQLACRTARTARRSLGKEIGAAAALWQRVSAPSLRRPIDAGRSVVSSTSLAATVAGACHLQTLAEPGQPAAEVLAREAVSGKRPLALGDAVRRRSPAAPLAATAALAEGSDRLFAGLAVELGYEHMPSCRLRRLITRRPSRTPPEATSIAHCYGVLLA